MCTIAYLVGGFNPFEKNARQNGFIFPRVRGEHEKIFELPTPSLWLKKNPSQIEINQSEYNQQNLAKVEVGCTPLKN